MKSLSWTPIKHAFASVALVTACSTSAWSADLPDFTFTPTAVGLTGAPVTADNILVSDFSSVTLTGATTFAEQGFLSITGFQLGGVNVVAGGLNSTYSLYLSFNGTGHNTLGNSGSNLNTTVTAGVFDTLNYSLIGASGNSTFGFMGTTPTVTSVAPQTLATGSLINGNTVTSPADGNTALCQAPTPLSRLSRRPASRDSSRHSPSITWHSPRSRILFPLLRRSPADSSLTMAGALSTSRRQFRNPKRML
jgi:hypothetical protein